MNQKAFCDKWIYKINPDLPPMMLKNAIKQLKELKNYSKSIVSKDLSKPIEENDTIYSPDYVGTVNQQIRNTTNDWIPWDHWLAGILHNLMIAANIDYYQYDLEFFDTRIQATSYEEGEYYDWHCDGNIVRPDGQERKLSISLPLNDNFEGGEMEFQLIPEQTHKFELKAGEAIIFPSWLPHRVKPITKGHRYSLVAWMSGPKFK